MLLIIGNYMKQNIWYVGVKLEINQIYLQFFQVFVKYEKYAYITQWAEKEEIKTTKNFKHFKLNKNKNEVYKILQTKTKAVLKRKFIALIACVRKEEKSKNQ